MPLIDQMGVELGKVLAKNILAQLDKPEDVAGHDSSVSPPIILTFNEPLLLTCRRSLPLLNTIDNWSHSLLPRKNPNIKNWILRLPPGSRIHCILRLLLPCRVRATSEGTGELGRGIEPVTEVNLQLSCKALS